MSPNLHNVYNVAISYIKQVCIMLRIIIIALLSLHSLLSYATQKSSLYQIDMIIFAHQQISRGSDNSNTPMATKSQHAIPLQISSKNTRTPYQILPTSSSSLNQEYWALSRKSDYRVLAHYSWLQPSNSQRAVTLPEINRSGWNIEGTVRVRQSNYYLLDTNLVFSSNTNKHATFLFSQKQRLKPGAVYYLDHPQAGILIKVHQIT